MQGYIQREQVKTTEENTFWNSIIIKVYIVFNRFPFKKYWCLKEWEDSSA